MSGEATHERVSRAAALRMAALGAAGAAGVMMADAPAAEATTTDDYFEAVNNSDTNLFEAFSNGSGSQGKGYYNGGYFTGINTGVSGTSTSGNGVYASSGSSGGSSGAAVFGQAFGDGDALRGYARGAGAGVYGESAVNGDGVYGVADGLGAGVHGVGNGGAAVRAEDISGVDTANGVLATSYAGTAVNASTQSGTAIAALANGASGTALFVSGRAVYSNCGVATVNGTVASPKQAVSFKGALLTANSVVIATLQANIAGVFIASAVPHVAAGTVTINLNQPVTQHVKVGWFVCDLNPFGPV